MQDTVPNLSTVCILHLGSKAMFYLAAAVSDFYIPASEMPEHKIQSSNGPLQVSVGVKVPANSAVHGELHGK